MTTSFSGGRSRSTRRESLTMGKQLVNFITCGCESSASFFCNLQSRTRTDAVLVIGLYELLGNPTTSHKTTTYHVYAYGYNVTWLTSSQQRNDITWMNTKIAKHWLHEHIYKRSVNTGDGSHGLNQQHWPVRL
jgi:hypothetical protein